MRLDFGFYPRRYDHTIGDITISTLPELEETVAHIRGHEWVQDHYFHVPTPHRVFAMPKTHAIEHAAAQICVLAFARRELRPSCCPCCRHLDPLRLPECR